jgi:lysophospholipase L1-like esterase
MSYRGAAELARRFLANSALVIASCTFVLVVMELSLRAYAWLLPPPPIQSHASVAAEHLPPPTISASFNINDIHVPPELIAESAARKRYITMPNAWKRRTVNVPGSAWSFYWQGVLHIHNAAGMRQTTPFPKKRPGVYRVMVVGDSLTYGVGIEKRDTFVALLNKWLGKDYRIELLNMGISGYQSEDILGEIKKYVPQLKPNLVIYAICQNDFLPSGVEQYENYNQFAIPLPESLKNYLVSHTYTGAFLNTMYAGALRGLHIRNDFYDDILSNFGNYKNRFRHDVKNMNSFIEASGLPPLVAMVLDQYPAYKGRGYQIAKIAEDAVRKAGGEIIPTEQYYIKYNSKSMRVSKWEGHPDEVANYIWASMIALELQHRLDLHAFKRTAAPSTPSSQTISSAANDGMPSGPVTPLTGAATPTASNFVQAPKEVK